MRAGLTDRERGMLIYALHSAPLERAGDAVHQPEFLRDDEADFAALADRLSDAAVILALTGPQAVALEACANVGAEGCPDETLAGLANYVIETGLAQPEPQPDSEASPEPGLTPERAAELVERNALVEVTFGDARAHGQAVESGLRMLVLERADGDLVPLRLDAITSAEEVDA
jgi:hypothetical protein